MEPEQTEFNVMSRNRSNSPREIGSIPSSTSNREEIQVPGNVVEEGYDMEVNSFSWRDNFVSLHPAISRGDKTHR